MMNSHLVIITASNKQFQSYMWSVRIHLSVCLIKFKTIRQNKLKMLIILKILIKKANNKRKLKWLIELESLRVFCLDRNKAIDIFNHFLMKLAPKYYMKSRLNL